MPLLRKSPRSSVFLRVLALAGSAVLLFQLPAAKAQSLYWNVASGSWGTIGNWADTPGGTTSTAFPVNGTGDYYLDNGTSGVPTEATMPGTVSSGRNIASLTVGAYNTLLLTGTSATGTAGTPRINGNLVNAGLIQSSRSSTPASG